MTDYFIKQLYSSLPDTKREFDTLHETNIYSTINRHLLILSQYDVNYYI